ncbi:MAG: hypothetical protein IPL65_17380 [Lewinellaceae bacterium]|nr:hypothetical protein [Lewinellaceae bacterium]
MEKNIFWLMQLVCIIVGFSCLVKKGAATVEKVKCNDCETFITYIENNWRADSAGLYFFVAPPDCEELIHGKTGVSYTMIVGRNCLIGSHIAEVKTLFGTPTKEYQNRFDYYMTDKCQGRARGDLPNIPGCIRLQVYFDENKKVVGVGGMTRE